MRATANSDSLRQAGLKTTLPRLKILSILEQGDNRHITAEDVYKILLDAGDEVGLATVYRVLTQFESAGLVIRHNFEGGRSIFELNDESHHDHMICVKCGSVTEFVDEVIEKRQQEVAKKARFTIEDHTLHLYGTCRACTKAAG